MRKRRVWSCRSRSAPCTGSFPTRRSGAGARVDAWVAAHGGSLQDEPAPEIQPWGYAVRIEGALVWTDDLH